MEKKPATKIGTKDDIKISKKNFIQYKRGTIEKDYKIGETVGSGAFATVKKVICKANDQLRALKIIKKLKGRDNARNFLEVEILKKLVHPNIMQIFECYEDEKNFYIITEFCEGGELFDKITQKGQFSEKEAAQIMYQLLSACGYIHSNNVVHRDLKPENILLDTNNDYLIKIIDWGTARNFDPTKKMRNMSGTPYYIAPEVIKGKYDEKCDVWSCGVILYILLCGYPPFNADTDEEIIERISRGKFCFPDEEWSLVSEDAKKFVCKLLEYDPKKRVSALKALEDPWIIKNKNSSISDKNLPVNCLKNMKQFHAKKKLQQATLTYIVHNLLSKQEKNALLELFQKFDTNGDGVLSKEEITNGYKEYMPLGEVEKEVDRIFKEVSKINNNI